MSKEKNKRSTLWTCILYPESMHENYKIILQEKQISFAVSPLHNLDINADGEIKKDHHHIVMQFPSLKSYNQVNEICEEIHSTIPQVCNSLKGIIRYFSHKDNPEKAQYNEQEIYAYMIDVNDINELTTSERKTILKNICEYIVSADIKEYADLVEYAMFNEDKWFDVLQSSHTLFLTSFIRSRKFRNINNGERE